MQVPSTSKIEYCFTTSVLCCLQVTNDSGCMLAVKILPVYRRLLFMESNVLKHMAGVGDAAFTRPWQKLSRSDDVECKASLFIEPMKWMERLNIHETSGKVRLKYRIYLVIA